MFLGEFAHTIDSKGRLAVPAKFRGALADGAVVTRGLDGCLALYPAAEWPNRAAKLDALPVTDANARSFQRFMLASAMVAELDKQGRVVLPIYLRRYAGIVSEVVVVGLSSRIEIWDAAKWRELTTSIEANADEVAARLTDLGI